MSVPVISMTSTSIYALVLTEIIQKTTSAEVAIPDIADISMTLKEGASAFAFPPANIKAAPIITHMIMRTVFASIASRKPSIRELVFFPKNPFVAPAKTDNERKIYPITNVP